MRKMIAWVLTVALILGLIPGAVLAAERNTAAESIWEQLEDKTEALTESEVAVDQEIQQVSEETQTVTATGVYEDFTYSVINSEAVTITGYTGRAATVVIPETIEGYPVTVIGPEAFYSKATILNVDFPDALTKIGYSAFYKCVALERIEIPDSVYSLGLDCFAYCSNLQSANIPLSWTECPKGEYGNDGAQYQGNIFEGCVKLTGITVPEGIEKIPDYGFSCCDTLTSIKLPSTLKSIGKCAFICCEKLETISIPEGVTLIPHEAFYSCDALKSVDFPDALTKIGYSAFYKCAALERIEIPDSVYSLGLDCFAYCTNLQSANIPLSWTECPKGEYGNDGAQYQGNIFEGCVKLTSITVPEGIEKIPDYGFSCCDTLTSIKLPSTLKSIGKCAFISCKKLKDVVISGVACNFGSNAFYGAPNVKFHCKWISDATCYAILNGVNFKLLIPQETDYQNYIIDTKESAYYTSSAEEQIKRYVLLTVKYKIDDAAFSLVSTPKIEIGFSKNLELSGRSVVCDGKLISDFTYKNNVLTIPVTKASGTIQLSANPIAYGKIASYAKLKYVQNQKVCGDVIGIVYADTPILTINVPNYISTKSIALTGLTGAEEMVILSIDGHEAGTVQSKKDGTFSANLQFPFDPTSEKAYVISACLQRDREIVASEEFYYNKGAPDLTKFELYYSNGVKKQKINMLSDAEVAAVHRIYPNAGYRFEMEFENAEDIAKVSVISARNGISSKIEAKKTGIDGVYVAEGYFEGTSRGYVPGKLSLCYTTYTDPETYSEPISIGNLPEEWQNAEVTKTVDTEKVQQGTIAFRNGDGVDYETEKRVSLAQLRKELLPNTVDLPAPMSDGEDDLEMIKYFFEELEDEYKDNVISNLKDLQETEKGDALAIIKDDIGNRFIYIFWDSAKESIEKVSVSLTGALFVYEKSNIPWKDAVGAWGFITNSGVAVLKTYGDMIALDHAKLDVQSSTILSPEQKAYASAKIDTLYWGYGALNLLRFASAAASYGLTAAYGPLVGTLAGMVFNLAADLAEDYLDQSLAYYVAGRQGSYLRWLVDPSGYVYDVDTGEYLEGVAVTAHWIPYDAENADFWLKMPADTEYGSLWMASEYSQANPLITDADGGYAWDVPEGWWRVKYEKENYETVWSDWMPVPPPQTEVNIGMTFTGDRGYVFSCTDTTETSATVSLINSTTSSSTVTYVLAAYDENGRMASCETETVTLDASEKTSLTVTIDSAVAWVKGFVLDAKTNAPLSPMWRKQLAVR